MPQTHDITTDQGDRMAKLDTKPYSLPDPDYSDYLNSPDTKAFDALFEASKQIDLDAGEIVGGMLRWQRADGYAWYIVTKDKPLTLQHVPYGDAYTVEAALIRGLNRQDITQMLIREHNLRAMFAKGNP